MFNVYLSAENSPRRSVIASGFLTLDAALQHTVTECEELGFDYIWFEKDGDNAADIFAAKTGTFTSKIFSIEEAR